MRLHASPRRPAAIAPPNRPHVIAALVAALLLGVGPVAAAEDAPVPAGRDFADLFRPARTEKVALSPNGEYIAYTLREGDRLSILVSSTARLDEALTRVAAVDDAQATPRFGEHREKVPAAINWMQWTDDERVVVETNGHVATGPDRSIPGVIMTFTREGRDARVLLTARDVPALVTAVDPAADLSRNSAPLAPTVDDPYYSQGGTAAAREAAREEDPLADGALFDAGDRFNLLAGRENDVIDPETGFGFLPLSPEVLDLDPQSAQHVRIRTVSDARVVLRRLNVTTGSTEPIGDYPIDPDRQLLADRQGVPRLSVPATTNTAFPHRPRLERGAGAKRRGNLAERLGLPAPAFDVSPANFFTHRAIPLGFDENPSVLYFASNLGRETYGLYAADLENGQTTAFAVEHPALDLIPRPQDAFLPPGTLVFDRHTRQLRGIRVTDRQHTTRWFDPVLHAAQATLEQALPGRNVEILEWDAALRRLVVFSSSPADPGRFHLYDRQSRQLVEFAQRAPWLNDGPATRTARFSIRTSRGHDVAGQVTLPQSPRVTPAPLIVVCPPNPWERLSPDFQPEVNALARMGFAVLQFAGRGAWGRGVRHREAVREGYADAQVADLLSVVDEIGRSSEFDARRVGLVGTGHGGHLALYALATHPDRFRCAVALEPPIDLAAWLRQDDWSSRSPATQLTRAYYGDAAWLETHTLAEAAERITKPAFILSYPGEDGTWRRSTHLAASAFARRLGARHPDSRFHALSHDFAKGLPLAKAAVFGEIERFLNANVYNFGVTIGESVEVD